MFRILYRFTLTGFLLASACAAHAACGGSYQRMQVGVLPDLFLVHPPAPTVAPALPGPAGAALRGKTARLSYTGNLDLRNGDCNVYGRVTAPKVGMASTYGAPCDPERDPAACPLVASPGFTGVAPATTDVGIKSWPVRAVAQPDARDKSIGGIELFGVDCAGDICQIPDCLQVQPEEFALGCSRFDPTQAAWGSLLKNYGRAYMVGRGNVYVGPYQPTAFMVKADSDTDALPIDHWIANENANAVILVTPRATKGVALQHHAVTYSRETGRWAIVPAPGNRVRAGTEFNVHVMGNEGRGRQVRAADGRTRQEIDDPLANGNPNALLLVTPELGVRCRQQQPSDGSVPSGAPEGAWVCTPSEPFGHALAVAYDAARGRWSVVSPSGARFKSSMKFHVFVAGLPGRYRESIVRYDGTPEYFGRLETSVEGPIAPTVRVVPRVFTAGSDSFVFATVNLTPRTPLRLPLAVPAPPPSDAPVGVAYQSGSWRVLTPTGIPVRPMAVNLFAPLPAR